MVVDGRTELAAPDLELARLLRRTGKPLFLAVNKVDSAKQDSLADDFGQLGVRDIFPISAEHGRGIDDLLDAVVAVLPKREPETTEGAENTEEFAETSGQAAMSRRKSRSLKRSSKPSTPVEVPMSYEREPATEGKRLAANDEFPYDVRPTADDEVANDEPATTEVKVAIIGHPNVGKSTLLNRLTGSDRAIVSPVPGTTRD